MLQQYAADSLPVAEKDAFSPQPFFSGFADNNREAASVIKEISAAWLRDFTGITETLTVCADVCCLVRKHGRA